MHVYKMKDKTDKFTVKKSPMFDLPMRLLMIGRTGCGKSNLLGNLLLRPEMYRDDFLPENIYIFSGSLKGDVKLHTIIEQLEIPESNLFDNFDEEVGHIIYDDIVEKFNDAVEAKEKPEQSLIIFDDLGFTNLQKGKKNNDILDKILCNGRKFLISTITLNQKLTQLSTNAREQCSGCILGKSTNKQLDLVADDFNYLNGKKNKQRFLDMVKTNTKGKHNFIVFNFSNGNNIYQNERFENICTCEGESICGGIK